MAREPGRRQRIRRTIETTAFIVCVAALTTLVAYGLVGATILVIGLIADGTLEPVPTIAFAVLILSGTVSIISAALAHPRN